MAALWPSTHHTAPCEGHVHHTQTCSAFLLNIGSLPSPGPPIPLSLSCFTLHSHCIFATWKHVLSYWCLLSVSSIGNKLFQGHCVGRCSHLCLRNSTQYESAAGMNKAKAFWVAVNVINARILLLVLLQLVILT